MQRAETSKTMFPCKRRVHLHESAIFETIFEQMQKYLQNDAKKYLKMIERSIWISLKKWCEKHWTISPKIRQALMLSSKRGAQGGTTNLFVRDMFPHTCIFTQVRPTSAPWPFLQLWRTKLTLAKLFFRALQILILEHLLLTLVPLGALLVAFESFGVRTCFYPVWFVLRCVFLWFQFELLLFVIQHRMFPKRQLDIAQIISIVLWDNCHTEWIYKR